MLGILFWVVVVAAVIGVVLLIFIWDAMLAAFCVGLVGFVAACIIGFNWNAEYEQRELEKCTSQGGQQLKSQQGKSVYTDCFVVIDGKIVAIDV